MLWITETELVGQLPIRNHIQQLFRLVILFPKHSLPKFLLFPRTKMTSPSLHFFLGIILRAVRTQSATEMPPDRRECPVSFLACIHAHHTRICVCVHTHTHTHTHTLHMTTPSMLGRWQWKKQVKVPTLKMFIHFQVLSTQNTFIQSKSFLVMSIPS